jgi:ABC-2 type transport system ATP-binding protein
MINVENLIYHYPKQPRLFDDLTLSVSSGNIVGLLGKNGAGKTSLLKLFTGLSFSLRGKVEVMGFDPAKRLPDFLNNVFFVPEEYYLPSISINDYCKGNCIFYPNFDKGLLKKLLVEFELSEVANIGRLSQGQRKKFFIAFALSTRCKLLVMDEPTNGLDIPSKVMFRKIVASVLTDDQLVIISTHQVKDVENLIDQIVIIDQGKIIFNENIAVISDKLSFIEAPSLAHDNILYSEQSPGGFKFIIPKDGIETNIDIEVLFNAITNGKFNMQ